MTGHFARHHVCPAYARKKGICATAGWKAKNRIWTSHQRISNEWLWINTSEIHVKSLTWDSLNLHPTNTFNIRCSPTGVQTDPRTIFSLPFCNCWDLGETLSWLVIYMNCLWHGSNKFFLAPPINQIWLPKRGLLAEKSRKIFVFSPNCDKASNSYALVGSFD